MMPQQTDRPSCRPQPSVSNTLIFHHAVAFLLLTCSHGGQSQLIGQPQSIVAMVGDDVILPCHMKPGTDAVNEMLEWSRLDLTPRFVHVRRSGVDRLKNQNPSYMGRTSASIERLKQGDMSLILSKVKFSDEGTYRCFVPALNTESNVRLVVVLDVVIEITRVSSGVLECKSKGWHAEPEVFWLDGEGNQLSGGSTEASKGSDDLYTVSSRVTVEKTHSNNFTCRVQQKNINQTREAHILVPDDFFTDSSSSSSSAHIIVGLVAGILLILAVAFLGWKWRQHKDNTKKKEETPIGGGSRSNSISNHSEQECLIERETDEENLTAEGDTMKNQNMAEDKNITVPLNEETGPSCPTEEKTQQEKLRTEGGTDNGLIQRQPENTGTGSQSVMEDGREQHEVQKGGETMNDSDIETVTGSISVDPQGRETQQGKPENNVDMSRQEEAQSVSTEPAAQVVKDGDGQEQQSRAGNEVKTDPDEHTQTTNKETANQSQTEGNKQNETQTGSEIHTEEDDETEGSGPQQIENQQEKSDVDVDTVTEEEESNTVSTERAAQSLMEGETDGENLTAEGDTMQNQNMAEDKKITVPLNEATGPSCPTEEKTHQSPVAGQTDPLPAGKGQSDIKKEEQVNASTCTLQ